MNLSHAYLPRPDAADSQRLLLYALDAGVTLLDAAALYGFGGNEELLGRTVMHRRDTFTLASKCVLGGSDGKRGIDGSPAAINRMMEESLRRLNTEHITSTICTTSIGTCRSKNRSARWRGQWRPARSARSDCPKCRRRRCGGPMPFIRSPRCRPNIPHGRAIPRLRCSTPAQN
jgi:hypothetical protein